ncbi:leucine-rich repeat/extensin 1 [Actinidia rufa]|uniref:Cell wall hydroxyproline-rich glycoprotein n=1 Tax=Actinidia rufa TaxID=165716 RepID=A0A7J0HG49_9ERIC|nr:leucine-rich repeat/extensin 1 [Actinidia rufa]
MPQPFCHNDKDDSSSNDVNKLQFENARLRKAYIALQSWKSAIFSDPFNFTADWTGPDVCSYAGVFCAPSPSDPTMRVVAGIDLNHADIAGYLPPELGLLTDLALFHINSNRFCGSVPLTFLRMKLLHELDLSKQPLCWKIPRSGSGLAVSKVPGSPLQRIRGTRAIKALRQGFRCYFPKRQQVPVRYPGEPWELSGVGAGVCQQQSRRGSLPSTIGWMKSLEQLDVAHNRFTGIIPSTVCKLPNLKNFTYSFNYFIGGDCAAGAYTSDGGNNCIAGKAGQRSSRECSSEAARPIDCKKTKCESSSNKSGSVSRRSSTSPPPPSPSAAHSPRPFIKPSPPPPSSKSSPAFRSHPPPPPPKTHLPPPPIEQRYSPPPPIWLSPPTYSSPPPSYHHSSPPPPTEKMSPKTHHAPPPPTIANTPPPPQIYYHVPPVPKTSLPPPPPPVGHYVPPPPYEQNTAPPPIEVPSPDYKSYASPPPPLPPPPPPPNSFPPSVAPSPEAGCGTVPGSSSPPPPPTQHWYFPPSSQPPPNDYSPSHPHSHRYLITHPFLR